MRFDKMSDQELLDKRLDLERERAEKMEELALAKRRAWVEKKYLPIQEFYDLERSVKSFGIQMQTIQNELSKRRKARIAAETAKRDMQREKREEEKANQPVFEKRFVDTARLMLPARLFRDICRAASGVIELVPNPEHDTEVLP